ncbi:histone deacetylase 5 [Artemisia annua]|uniref:Histone deacetylase 5 n=1 Tax=Artemisia annua TaxID=35608 RepID=A0A2U1LHT3_ARTAN|nr:histone deacetylase 5 [Artemisia annua]
MKEIQTKIPLCYVIIEVPVQENTRADTGFGFVQDGWYHNVLYLGKESDVLIITMKCTRAHVEGFKYGKILICAPAKEYANTLVRGLVQGKQLSEDEVVAYIQEASTKPL